MSTLRERLIALRERRESLKAENRRPRGSCLTEAERATILSKTDGRCHLCGGEIDPEDWQADHVFAHSAGGEHSADNYLAAHVTCNNYRWDYLPEEFQIILKLGVWARTQIQKGAPVVAVLLTAPSRHEGAIAEVAATRPRFVAAACR